MHVTLTWAQSLDGCIAARPGAPTAISGPPAMRMTHELRAAHDAILVGIGTVLADNPRLSNRLAPGPSPQPVVLDSLLRCPPTAHVIHAATRPAWLLATPAAPAGRAQALQAAGARVERVASSEDGRVDLRAALAALAALGVGSLMVEGGARVITAFLQQRLAHRLIVTIAPRFLTGLPAIAGADLSALQLRQVTYHPLGADVIMEADLE